ncbi:hypothetical protein SBA4_330037 [Candidatus Sulfopaludibacter sp. SbA4]|nr:hypothetical protein SBA4_330037 [Candidatus Sulfopaludibacter sp. SbA4]
MRLKEEDIKVKISTYSGTTEFGLLDQYSRGANPEKVRIGGAASLNHNGLERKNCA